VPPNGPPPDFGAGPANLPAGFTPPPGFVPPNGPPPDFGAGPANLPAGFTPPPGFAPPNNPGGLPGGGAPGGFPGGTLPPGFTQGPDGSILGPDGQPVAPGNIPGGLPLGADAPTVVPLVATGVFDATSGAQYKTTVQITNPSSSTVTLSAEFFKTDGTPLTGAFEARINGVSASQDSLNNFELPPNSTATITGSSADGPASGWGRIRSSSHVTVSSFLDVSDVKTGASLSRVWLSPTATDLRRFAVPRTRNAATGADAGFVIVNTGSSSANFTSTLYDENRTVMASKTTTLAPLQQMSTTAQQYFGLSGEPSTAYHSYIMVDSDSSQLAAVAVAFDGKNFVTLPVDRIPDEPAAKTFSRVKE